MTRVKVKERNAAIRRGFDVLTSPAPAKSEPGSHLSMSIGLSARRACLKLAEDYGVSYRHVWRILKEMQ